MNNNNPDIAQLMNILSKMDKKDLENGINKLNTMLNSKDKEQLINQLKNNINNK